MEFKKNIITLLTSLLEGEIDIDILTKMSAGLDFPVMINRMAKVFEQFVQDEMGACDLKDLNLNKLQDKLDNTSLDGIVSEAFEIFILMHSITDTIKDAEHHLTKDKFTVESMKAYDFIRMNMGRIEINFNGL